MIHTALHKRLLTSLIISLLANPVLAGTLDDLETQSTTKSSGKSTHSGSGGTYKSSQDDDSSDPIGGAIVLIALTAVVINLTAKAVGVLAKGGGNSVERYQQTQNVSAENENGEPSLFRKKGDPILPTLRFSSQWLNGSGNVSGQLNRVEAGFGFIGISRSQNRLTEPNDKLTIKQTLMHYRMSFGNNLSWDLAFGKGSMKGNKHHSGNVFAMPIRLRLGQSIHVEYYPVWSNFGGSRLSEHQLSVNWQKENIGLSTGFKTLKAGNTSVNGLFAGVYVNF
jgi:hypothetical protein